MKNSDVINNFLNGQYQGSCGNLSFRDGKLYSYSTCIAKFTKTLNTNTKILIISSNTFSKTTAKHLAALNFQTCLPCLFIHNWRGELDFNYLEAIKHSYKELTLLSAQLNKKKVCEAFIFEYENIISLLALLLTNEERARLETLIREFSATYYQIKYNIDEYIKSKRLQLAQKNKPLKAKKKELIANGSLLDREVYKTLTKAEKNYLTGNDKYQLIFKAKTQDRFITSEGYIVDKKEVVRILKLYLNKAINRFEVVTCYTPNLSQAAYSIYYTTKKELQVGCHHIPSFVIKALIKDLKLDKVQEVV